jgi:hypothetical protein
MIFSAGLDCFVIFYVLIFMIIIMTMCCVFVETLFEYYNNKGNPTVKPVKLYTARF